MILIRKLANILFSLLLVFTTTNSVWSQFIDNEDDPIEVQAEEENNSEKREKEKDNKFDDPVDGFANGNGERTPLINGRSNKTNSTSFVQFNLKPNRLYIEFQHLKLDC